MAFRADLSAWLMQKSAPLTVDYGKDLVFAGADLPAPTRIRVPTRHGRVRCDVYRPAAPQPDPPVYVHLHGGAFMMRHPRMDDFFARYVAATCGAAVVNVDYAWPRRPATRWPRSRPTTWPPGWPRTAPAGLGRGPGRGRRLQRGRQPRRERRACRPATGAPSPRALQVLGRARRSTSPRPVETKTSPVARPMVSPGVQRLVRATYFRDEARRAEPYASPCSPPTWPASPRRWSSPPSTTCCGAEGDAYAARLAEAGVAVVHRVVTGRDHYFLDGDPAPARSTLDLVAHRLRESVGTDRSRRLGCRA